MLRDKEFEEKFEALCAEFEMEYVHIASVQRTKPEVYEPPYPPPNEYSFNFGKFISESARKVLDLVPDSPDGYKYILASDAWRLLEHAANAKEVIKGTMAYLAEDFRAMTYLESLMKDRLGIYSGRMVPLKMDAAYYVETEETSYTMSYNKELSWSIIANDGKLIHGATDLRFIGCVQERPDAGIGEILNIDGMPIIVLGCRMLFGVTEQVGQFSSIKPKWHTGPVRLVQEVAERN